MDTSELYIKMCDCPEIQQKWVILMDLMAHPTTDPHDYSAYLVRENKEMACLWLPRQDQIQEMMGANSKEPFCTWLEGLGKFIHIAQPWDIPIDKSGLKTIGWFETWEQLWLAFYMHEKHKKIWDGEKWVGI